MSNPCYGPCGSWGDYDDNDPGDSGGGGDSTPPTNAEACLSLTQVGLPDGCTRELANAGTPQHLLNSYLQLDHIMLTNPIVRTLAHNATYQLQTCYANVSYTPESCENNFVSSLHNIQLVLPHELRIEAQYAANGIEAVVNLARQERSLTSWLNFFSAGGSYMGISVNIPLSLSISFVRFNQLLAAARQQRVCQLWISAWDSNGCN